MRDGAADEHRPVYDAVIEVWQDTNDPIDETFEEWAHWHVERDSYDPALWFLAVAGDELAGFSSAGRSRSIRTPATSTCSACGGRGGGRVSARRSCSARSPSSASAGYTRGTLGVDASSLTGATRLYERAGMRVYRDTVFLERAVRE